MTLKFVEYNTTLEEHFVIKNGILIKCHKPKFNGLNRISLAIYDLKSIAPNAFSDLY